MIFEVCVLFCQYNSPIWNQLLSVDLAILKQPTTTHACLAFHQYSHAKDCQNLSRVKKINWRLKNCVQGKGNIKVNNGERVDWPHSFIFSNANFKISKLFINRKMQQQRNGSHTFVSYPFSFLLYAFDQRPLFGHHGVLIKTVEMLNETKKYTGKSYRLDRHIFPG